MVALAEEVRFASPAVPAARAAGMTETFARIVERDHDEDAPGGRSFRVVFGSHPCLGRRGDRLKVCARGLREFVLQLLC